MIWSWAVVLGEITSITQSGAPRQPRSSGFPESHTTLMSG